MKSFLFSFSFLLLTLFSVSCQGTKGDASADPAASGGPAAAGIVNSKCPGAPDKDARTDVTVDYKGQKVGFCCEGCIDTWKEMSDEQKDKFLQGQKAMRK